MPATVCFFHAPSYGKKTDEALEWNKKGSIEQLLKVYKDFDPAVLQLMKKVNPDEVNVWQLLDMEAMPTWVNGKLALLGDAAHPFTPRKSCSKNLPT